VMAAQAVDLLKKYQFLRALEASWEFLRL